MSNIAVAKRYAKALFEVANEQGIAAQVEEQLKMVVDTLQGHEELRSVMNHPKIDASSKMDLLKSIFSGHVSELVLNTLQLLVQRRRGNIVTALYYDYVRIANDSLGRIDATVYSPFDLDGDQEQNIASTFSGLTGKTVRVQTVIDKSLLGGIKVRVGDRLYDASLSGKLDRLQQSLKSQAL